MKRLEQEIGGGPAAPATTTTNSNSNGTKGKAKGAGAKRKRAAKLKEEESDSDEPVTKKTSDEGPVIKNEAEVLGEADEDDEATVD
jgi:hypothetical protein